MTCGCFFVAEGGVAVGGAAEVRYHQEGRSMSLEEAIIDRIRRLPPAKQEELLRFADGLQQRAVARATQFSDRTQEMKWISANRTPYANQWVALEGDRLIAADADPHKVFAAFQSCGH
jgi:hypothetical protein